LAHLIACCLPNGRKRRKKGGFKLARRLPLSLGKPSPFFLTAMIPTAATSLAISAPALQTVQTPRNFLFIVPTPATAEDHALVEAIATTMSSMGYVYVASADQRLVEDRGAIRYLPFRAGHFPSFGTLDAIFVLRDREVANAALAEYPAAEAFVLDHQPAVVPAMAG
jgi:hypothetical protein